MSAKSSASGNTTLAIGTGKMGDVTSTASIELSGAQTWSCWINLNATNNSGLMTKIPSSLRGPAIRINSNKIYATFYPTVGSPTNAVDIEHTTTLSTGVWHHIILGYDGSQFMYVDVDGVVVSEDYFAQTATTLIGTSTDDLAIGAWGDFGGVTSPMDGDIALPMIFNADIDTSELVDGSGNARAYSALPIGLQSACVFAPTLVNDIPSDGQEETDQSTSSNDVTLIGSPTYTGETLIVAT